ncbi:MAG: FtsQ-type POTRA domain-containing protein [Candidatus Eisenbacteria bacterium]|uniref:FtsQ-type POTRA domain-containing protein n=1 Tax=Eiseniibacteriota bacterium TaxID=2212470 RepID=A0A849SS48_UNCEI|nr:FtsQ-type POTRA domain-containing protein [Candidatus Eisenbacteria bacterium]
MPTYQGRALNREPRSRRPLVRLVRLGQVLGVLTALALLLQMPWSVLRKRFAVVDHVRVRGAHYLDPVAVAEAAGVRKGDDLIAFDPRRARQSLRLHSRIADARVSRLLRDVVIEVNEREPVLLVQHGAPWEIDSTGVLLEPLQRGVVADVPLLVGSDLKSWPAGAQLRDPRVERGLAWMRALSRNELQLGGNVSEIDVSDGEATSLMLLTGTRVLAPAWPPELRRLSALRAVLMDIQHRGARADEVDVRFDRQVIVRPALVEAPPNLELTSNSTSGR